MAIFEFLILFVCGLVFFYVFKKPRNFPPGPWFPLVEELSSNRPRHLRYHDYLLRHGPVVSFQILGKYVFLLGDYDIIKNAFRRDEMSFRLTVIKDWKRCRDVNGHVSLENLGILHSNGRLWQENRRLALRSFRDLGFGKSRAEVIIQKEAEHMVRDISRSHGRKQLIDGSQFFSFVVNVIWFFLTSKSHDHKDKELLQLAQLLRQTLQGEFNRSLLAMFPLLFKALSRVTKYGIVSTMVKNIKALVKKEIQYHQKTLDKTNARDFLDAYLIAMSSDNASDTLSEDQLTIMGVDFFIAGSETVTTTLEWAVFYMVLYPEIQEKVFLELRNNLGSHLPSMEDKKKLPYTEAVISEVHRMGAVLPLSVAHVGTNDVTISGYTIPKGCKVFSSLYSLHYDDAYWKDPHVFRPERFLNEDKTAYVPNERLVPFGIGKRICLGESLARMEVFLFFTALVQRLKFSIPEDEPPPSGERAKGITCAPKPFHVVVHDRKLEQ